VNCAGSRHRGGVWFALDGDIDAAVRCLDGIDLAAIPVQNYSGRSVQADAVHPAEKT
jgi:hypothetical protein